MFHGEEIWTICGLASNVRVTEASIFARKQFGSVHESLRMTSPNKSLLNPVRFGQLRRDPAVRLCIAFACPHAAKGRVEGFLLLARRELGNHQSVANSDPIFQERLGHFALL